MDLVSLEERSNVAFSNDDSPPPRMSISTCAMTDVMKKAEEEEEIARKLFVNSKPDGEELPGSPSFRFYFQQASAIESLTHGDQKEDAELLEKSKVQQQSCEREESIASSHSNAKEKSTTKCDGENSSSASHSNEEPIAICKRDEGCASSNSNEGSTKKGARKAKGRRFRSFMRGQNAIYSFLSARNCYSHKNLEHGSTHARIAPQPLSEKDS